jgi:hypothetical protein
MMKHAEVEVSLYWTWQNNYEIMSNDSLKKYPSYFVTRQQVEHFNNGLQVIHSISSDPDVLVFAGMKPDGTNAAHVINLKKTPVEINVTGFNAKPSSVISSTVNNSWEEIRLIGKPKNIILKPESVNTLIFK